MLGDIREGVHDAVLVVALGELNRLRGRRHRDAASMELRNDHPTDLVGLLAAPLLGPEAHRADAGAAHHVDNLEHAIAALEALVAALPLAQTDVTIMSTIEGRAPSRRGSRRVRRPFASSLVLADTYHSIAGRKDRILQRGIP